MERDERIHGRDLARGFGRGCARGNLEVEMAENTCPRVCLIEMKDISRQESGQSLQVKGEGGMILTCIPLQPKADTREIYHLQPQTQQRIDSL